MAMASWNRPDGPWPYGTVTRHWVEVPEKDSHGRPIFQMHPYMVTLDSESAMLVLANEDTERWITAAGEAPPQAARAIPIMSAKPQAYDGSWPTAARCGTQQVHTLLSTNVSYATTLGLQKRDRYPSGWRRERLQALVSCRESCMSRGLPNHYVLA